MGYLAHIQRCNAHNLSGFSPFALGGVQVGWVRPAVLDVVRRIAGFEASTAGLALSERVTSFADRSAALMEAAEALVAAGLVRKIRSEFYGVKNRWRDTPMAAVNRGAVPAFGLRAYGVHLNGWRRRADGEIEIWVGRRALDKSVAPGKLDNMVAGGQPIGLSLRANLIKEAAEEADVPAKLAATARPVGSVAYTMENGTGLKPDLMFCYDLEVPDDFVPRNTDGETIGFEVMTAREAGRLIRETDDFKFNVNLVITDFLMRHGLIDPANEPDYAEIKRGLANGDANA